MTKLRCFGIPSVFSFTSQTCVKCADFALCQAASHAALKAAPVHLVRNLLNSHDKYEKANGLATPNGLALNLTAQVPEQSVKSTRVLSHGQEEMLGGIPKSAAVALRKLMVLGLDEEALSAAKQGRNAFTLEGNRPFYVAMQTLLSHGFTKPYLTTMFQEQLGWSKASAQTQTSLVWRVFIAIGVAVEDGCGLIAAPGIAAKSRRVKYHFSVN